MIYLKRIEVHKNEGLYLHECIDSSDFYAEDNVIMVTKDRVKAIDKMVFLFNESKPRVFVMTLQ